MKYIYRIILSISTFIFLTVFSTTLQNVFDTSIPEVELTIQVEDWDKSRSSEEIYHDLKNYAQEKNIDIHKIVFKINENGETEKNIFTFSQDEVSSYQYDDGLLKTKSNFYDSSALLFENVLGGYAVTTQIPEDLVNDFRNFGLDVSIEKFSPFLLISEILFSVLGFLSLILFFSTIVAGMFYKLSQSKKYGVWMLNGKNILSIAFKDYFMDSLLVVSILALFSYLNFIFLRYYVIIGILLLFVFFLFNIVGTASVNKLSTITEKIKGKKDYGMLLYLNLFLKMAVVALTVLFSVNMINKITESQEVINGLAKWEEIGEYYQLYFSNGTSFVSKEKSSLSERKEQSKLNNKKVYPLLTSAEKNGGVLAKSNENELQERSGNPLSYLENNAFMMLNHNFFKVVDVRDEYHKTIGNLPDDRFYIIIPANEKHQTEKIKEEVEAYILLNKSVFVDEAVEPYEVEILYSEENQQIFNFNSENPQRNLSENPVMLVVSLKAIGENIDYLLSEVSQGNYLFKNYHAVYDEIEKNKLSEEFSGLMSIQELGLELLERNRQEYQMYILSILILMFVYIIIIFYTSLSYIEVDKKKLFLRYIHGSSFIQRHILFYTIMGITTFIITSVMALINSSFVIPALVCIVVEFIALSIIILYTEQSMRLNILKKEQ